MRFTKLMAIDWGDGNYLDSPAGSRDSLWDTLGKGANNIWDSVCTGFHNFCQDILIFIDKTSFWVACMCCIYHIWLYAATNDKKHSKKILTAILTYTFVKMILGGLIE